MRVGGAPTDVVPVGHTTVGAEGSGTTHSAPSTVSPDGHVAVMCDCRWTLAFTGTTTALAGDTVISVAALRSARLSRTRFTTAPLVD